MFPTYAIERAARSGAQRLHASEVDYAHPGKGVS